MQQRIGDPAETIGNVSTGDGAWIEADADTETAWTDTCMDIAHQTLFPRAASWIFGANIPGKKRTVMFYLGGMKAYREVLASESAHGYPGFRTHEDVLAA